MLGFCTGPTVTKRPLRLCGWTAVRLHMSFLDMIAPARRRGEGRPRLQPLVDVRSFCMVDVTLSRARQHEDDLEKIRMVRAHTRILVSLGDLRSRRTCRHAESLCPVAPAARIHRKCTITRSCLPVVPNCCQVATRAQVVDVDVFLQGARHR